jgi:hypothetical protein
MWSKLRGAVIANRANAQLLRGDGLAAAGFPAPRPVTVRRRPEKRGILPEADAGAEAKPDESDYMHGWNDVVPAGALFRSSAALTFSPSQNNALGGSKHHVRDSPQQ